MRTPSPSPTVGCRETGSASQGGVPEGGRKSKGEAGDAQARDLAAFRDAARPSNRGRAGTGEHTLLPPSTEPKGRGRGRGRKLGVGAGDDASASFPAFEATAGVARARVTFLVPDPKRPVSRGGEARGRGPRRGEAWCKQLRAEVYLGPVAAQVQPSVPRSLQTPRKEGLRVHSPRGAAPPGTRQSPAPNTSIALAAGP